MVEERRGGRARPSLGTVEGRESHLRLVYAEALAAQGRTAAARDAILEARDRVVEGADRIADATLRKSFLTRISENARTLELADAWA